MVFELVGLKEAGRSAGVQGVGSTTPWSRVASCTSWIASAAA